MAAAIVQQVLDLYSGMVAAVAMGSIDDCLIVAVSEVAVQLVQEPHQLNTLSTDVFQLDSIVVVPPVVQLDFVVRIVAPATVFAIELNPIGKYSIGHGQRWKEETFRSLK